MNIFNNKRVLLVGLGRLGGGVAIARFLAQKGAFLTVSDALSEKILRASIKKLKKYHILYELETAVPQNIASYDMVVCNQAVSIHSEVVKQAKKFNIPFFNDFTLLLALLKTQSHQPYIGITGTRGKTTTTIWISHLMGKNTIVGGNMPSKGSLSVFEKITKQPSSHIVLELSSFQLEYVQKGTEAPHISIITNLYQDHLNRHKTIKEYIRCKANIFLNQKKNDTLILNADDFCVKQFLAYKPKAHIWLVSRKKLPVGAVGMYEQRGILIFQEKNRTQEIIEVPIQYGTHEIYNLMQAMCAAYRQGVLWNTIVGRVATLPTIPFRQQVIIKNKNYTVINDSAATSPEGTSAAIEKFFLINKNTVLLCGGTDKQLNFTSLARVIQKYIEPRNLFLLNGSGTKKLIAALAKEKYRTRNQVYENLEDIARAVQKGTKRGVILFSPACASFEKFKNEFDRGRCFNKIARTYFV